MLDDLDVVTTIEKENKLAGHVGVVGNREIGQVTK